MVSAESAALPVFRPSRIGGNRFSDQFTERRQQLGIRSLTIVAGVSETVSFHRCSQLIYLIEEKRMSENLPPVDDEHLKINFSVDSRFQVNIQVTHQLVQAFHQRRRQPGNDFRSVLKILS